MTESVTVAIIGAGPAGLAAAARAAAVGLPHLLLEASPTIAATVAGYPRGKLVMTEPASLPLRSSLGFSAATREEVLESWGRELATIGAKVRTNARVLGVCRQNGSFLLTLAGGDQLVAEQVIVAIGRQGDLRRLELDGAGSPLVQYGVEDPSQHVGEMIVVVGAGDSAVETALSLAPHNRVLLLNRHEEFASCGEANLRRLGDALAASALEVRRCSTATAITHDGCDPFPVALVVDSPNGVERIACNRVIVRIGSLPASTSLQRLGIKFPDLEGGALPRISDWFESSVPGLYIIGALAGYSLIKQALNQGYEVIEHIRGQPLPPADEDLLRNKLAPVEGIDSVAAGIDFLYQRQPLLKSLNLVQLRGLLRDSDIRRRDTGDVIFRRNDFSNSFFFILTGAVSIHVQYPDGKRAEFALGPGEFFGEIGLLSGRRRTGTAIAGANCVLMETPQRSMLKLLDSAPDVQRQLDEVALKRALASCFGTALADEQVIELVKGAEERDFATGEPLFHQGDTANGLYWIRRGSVTISHRINDKDVVAAYLAAGNYVGEMALISGQPRSATVRAAAPTETVLLQASHFHAMIDRNPEVRKDLTTRYFAGLQAISASKEGGNSALVEFLVARGGGEATDMLLIDYERCIRCDNCERACAVVHQGVSLLDRRAGQTFGSIHVPASCRHCEHPKCMKDCPPDAIRRSPQGEIYISDTCIGCGNCREHCPYGVIQMGTPQPDRRPSLLDVLLGRKPAINGAAIGATTKAMKCDMCIGLLGGAACVRECPTGAARRIGPSEFHVLAGR
jgi:CRP-like cAMP-binding protein/Fe-S-cluster-containing hydrogenase component 2/thioredoxin reductase